MLKEFRDFAIKGNAIDMAIGIIIGSAFGKIVSSLVDDIIMPPIGLLLRGVDFSNLFVVLKDGSPSKPYTSLTIAKEAGAVTLNLGIFVNSFISFLIIAFAVYLLVKSINTLRSKEPQETVKATKECLFCKSEIPINAIRCPNCTSNLEIH